ncbi:putative LRR receptor-like serine/threonine-protein kinase [Hordeum vulgare]|nr:putative LRR receptor-like serine/threonine-protein kinase [Hordeum vulgare]
MERRVLDVVALPSSTTIEQVMPVTSMTTEPSVLPPTPNPNALFAKELCDLLASVEVTRPGLGRSIACLLTETPIRDKQQKGSLGVVAMLEVVNVVYLESTTRVACAIVGFIGM